MSIPSINSNKEIKRTKGNRRGFLRTFTGIFAGLSLFSAGKVLGKPDKKVNHLQSPSLSMGITPIMGEIIMFGGMFAPKGWEMCQGQLLSISENQALYSLLGSTYGGDGRVNFALPDLRGRSPIGKGTGPGLSNRELGSLIGAETDALAASEMPAHTHPAKCDISTGPRSLDRSPNGKLPAMSRNEAIYGTAADGTMNTGMVLNTGGGRPHNNMQPSLVINYIICTDGIYPPRW